ncbi:MAG: replication-associated recombination protein A [Candidatus Komeilibacteria bacterium]|nr:replication-associated recombination protein A [Candidatus Komeilibacteria bacterium]
MPDLFDQNLVKDQPLAERLRPKSLADFVGQQKIIGPKTVLYQAIQLDQIPSMIFWGPPGSGKTTLARIIANVTKSFFVPASAVTTGVSEVRKIIEESLWRKKTHQQRTILFLDEIHRFNKSQQDALLPAVENGTIILIGATTENPSFEVNGALLSRTKVFVLEKLNVKDLMVLIKRAAQDPKIFVGQKIELTEEAILFLAQMADGDARAALNSLELAVQTTRALKNGIIKVSLDKVKEAFQRQHLLYDKNGEEHYNIISALHKSLRASKVDAALYWLARMLEAGEDPLYVARRLVRFAAEDVGIKAPQALSLAVATFTACQQIGLPECKVHLAELVVFLAKIPKSNACYVAYEKVAKLVKNEPLYPVPLFLRNAPTKLMKELDYGKDYVYPYSENPMSGGSTQSKKSSTEQSFLPEAIKDLKFWNYD